MGCSTRELERLQREEAAFDAAEGLEGVDAVFLPPEDQAAAEAPPSSDSEPESESDSDEDEETAALRRQAEAERQRQRAAAEAAKQRRREREALDAAAARLAQLLPQQGQPPQSPAAAGQQQQPQRQGSSPASPEAAPQTWQRCALQVLRQAGGLPKQQSAPQTKQQQQQGKQGIARLEQKQVEELMRTCRVPSTQPLMAVLRAIAGATEVRGTAGLLGRAEAWLGR